MTETTKAPRLKSIAAPTGTFPVEITVQGLTGAQGTITFDCIARTQTAWARERGQLFDQARARQKAQSDKAGDAGAPDGEPAKEFDPEQLASLVSAGIKGDAEMVPHIAKGWDLDDEFNIASLAAMEDAYPGATSSLLTGYSQKIHGHRLGN